MTTCRCAPRQAAHAQAVDAAPDTGALAAWPCRIVKSFHSRSVFSRLLAVSSPSENFTRSRSARRGLSTALTCASALWRSLAREKWRAAWCAHCGGARAQSTHQNSVPRSYLGRQHAGNVVGGARGPNVCRAC